MLAQASVPLLRPAMLARASSAPVAVSVLATPPRIGGGMGQGVAGVDVELEIAIDT
jgi:hypothetical protein